MYRTMLPQLLARFHPVLRELSPALSLEILGALEGRELDMSGLAQLLGRERSQVSKRLKALKSVGLVAWQVRGREHRYQLTSHFEMKRDGAFAQVTISAEFGAMQFRIRLPSEADSLIEGKSDVSMGKPHDGSSSAR